MFDGAQIAVFPDAQCLTDKQMQLLARELNLSETVFVFPPANELNTRKIRIFSPLGEVAFGSHTIVAASYVLAVMEMIAIEGELTRLIFELSGGNVDICLSRAANGDITVQFSRNVTQKTDNYVPTHEEVASLLSLDVRDLSTRKYKILLSSADSIYLIVPASSLSAVYNAKFDYKAWAATSAPATLAKQVLLFSTQTD